MSTEFSFAELCHEFCGKLQGCMKKTNGDESRAFAPRGAVSDVFNERALQRICQAIGPSPDSEDQQNAFVEIIKEKKLQYFLATLLYASCSYRAAAAFAAEILQRNGSSGAALPGAGDYSLPATPERLLEILRDPTDVNKFQSNQACFCPVVLEKRGELRLEDAARQRLPYLDEKLRGEGSYGKVYSVRIAKGHFHDPTQAEFSPNSEALDLARKDFQISKQFARRDGREEREIMVKIFRESSCDYIVENWGSLQVGDVYSLFMPLAVCDLRVYMMELHAAKPTTMQEKVEILHCANGLATGLKFLHSGMGTADHGQMVCYHMDLKPSNVLVFQRPQSEGKIWKLSDFGMSRVKISRPSNERERDFSSWFKKRGGDDQTSVSATDNSRKEGTYLAPESKLKKAMTAKSDIWSLGCILSIVLSYLDNGKQGVDDYAEERSQHSGANDSDSFFVSNRVWKAPHVNPGVKAWHKRLVHEAKGRNPQERRALQDILSFLENCIFQMRPKERCQAQEVVSCLSTACTAYGKIGGSHTQVWSATQETEGAPNESHNGTEPAVSAWALNTSTPSKGCAISPDAAFVAYWSDVELKIYSSQSLPSSGGRAMVKPAGEYSLRSTGRFWKSIDLTSKYLFACVRESNLLYIFHLHAGTGPDVSLEEPMVMALGVGRIHMVSVSSDKKHIAFIVSPDNDSGKQASIVSASLFNLVGDAGKAHKAKPPNTASDARLAGVVQIGIPSGKYQMVDLERLVLEVHQVSMVDSNSIYVAMQPVVSAGSQEHVIPIMRVKLSDTGNHCHTINVKSDGLHTESSQFFTSFRPLQAGAAFVVVTRQTRLHILVAEDAGEDKDKEIHNYKILKLIPGGQSQTLIYAIGRRSNRDGLFLLEVNIHHQGNEGMVRIIAPFNHLSRDDNFVGMLSESNGEQFVLVAAVVSPDKPSIHRVTISGTG